MSTPPFIPVGSFVLPAGNIPVQAQPSQVHPFVGPIPVDSCLALLYQQGGGKKLVRLPHKTLRAASETGTDGMPFFDANPTSCPDCARPFYPHNGAGFTILFQCPHWPNDADPVWANEEIDAIIPDPPLRTKRLQAPLGNVLVLKHYALDWEPTGVDPTASTVFAVPLANVSPDDVSAIDGYVLRALSLLDAHRLGWRYFVQYEAAGRLHSSSGGKFFPLGFAAVVELAGPIMGDSDDPLASLLQGLQLQESSQGKRPAQRSRQPPVSPEHLRRLLARPPPPPPASPPLKSPSSSSSSATTTTSTLSSSSSSSSQAAPSTTKAVPVEPHIGKFLSVAVSTVRTNAQLTSRAQAASVQHSPGGSAIALRKNKPKHLKKMAEVPELTISHRPAVQELIVNFRFALQFGCESVAEAQALVDFASAKGWMSTSSTFRSRPLSLDSIPRPCSSASDLVGRPPHKERDPWYICYIGVHPGVYSSYLECALNTLGVSGNVHDHRETFEAALDEFMWAELDGHVKARESQTLVGSKTSPMFCHPFMSFAAQLIRVPAGAIQLQLKNGEAGRSRHEKAGQGRVDTTSSNGSKMWEKRPSMD
ncbi:hypothetical protein C8F01DRAFT_1094902 [Mycena amicta]|nr:hypothetical protein C8F01DRAFT_1094902 [Mycena amicta]